MSKATDRLGEPEEIEARMAREWDSGQACGQSQSIAVALAAISEEAGRLFVAGQDEKAALFRSLLEVVKKRALAAGIDGKAWGRP